MLTTLRYDRYVGPHHYWICSCLGTCEVRKSEYDNLFGSVLTVFRGHYEECVRFIDDREIEYMESLL